jgi:hypothetical protein
MLLSPVLKAPSIRHLKLYCISVQLRSSSLYSASLNGLAGDSALAHIIIANQSLQKLDLQYCSVTDEEIGLICKHVPRLQHLSVDRCRYLKNPEFILPELRSLSLPCSPQLNTPTFDIPSIRKLHLNECPVLRTATFLFPLLEFLDLKGSCASVTVITIQCPKLEKAQLGALAKLTQITICSAEIKDITLTNDRNLSGLKLDCPKLQKLVLDGCNKLSSANVEGWKKTTGLQALSIIKCANLKKSKPFFQELKAQFDSLTILLK